MADISIADWVGYLAMILVVSSFLFKNMNRLRVANLLGATAFIAYGVLLGIAWPIIITNSAIIVIQVFQLLKLKSSKNV
jgi:hypothetical protein